MEKTWQQKDGRWYLGDRLIENPAGYGAVCRARFLSQERRKDDRRPIHFSTDRPIPAEYNKPLPDNRLSGERRVNAWGMPIADDQPLNGLEFYKSRADDYASYLQAKLGLTIREREWILHMVEVLYWAVKECREQGPLAVRRRFAHLSGIPEKDGRAQKFIDLLQDVAASPGWFVRSREGGDYIDAKLTDMAAEHLWKHPRMRDLRRGLRLFIPRRRPHRTKTSIAHPRWH